MAALSVAHYLGVYFLVVAVILFLGSYAVEFLGLAKPFQKVNQTTRKLLTSRRGGGILA